MIAKKMKATGLSSKNYLNFQKKFNLKFPIIQAPMAGISTPELASDVTTNGGIGSLAFSGYINDIKKLESDYLSFEKQVQDERLKNNVNFNFFCHKCPVIDQEIFNKWNHNCNKYLKKIGESCQMTELKAPYLSFADVDDINHPVIKFIVSKSPIIVSFHFGLPSRKILEKLQEGNKISIFVTVTNLRELEKAIDMGVDGVILQSWNAGGHRGDFKGNDPDDEKLDTLSLCKLSVDYINGRDHTNIPWLVAAGGITNGSEIKQLLRMGISGVQIGTSFLLNNKSNTSNYLRQFLLDKERVGDYETIMTKAISGRNLRCLKTPYIEQISKDALDIAVPDYPLAYPLFKQIDRIAKSKDCNEFSASLLGTGFREIRNLNTKELFDTLKYEYDN